MTKLLSLMVLAMSSIIVNGCSSTPFGGKSTSGEQLAASGPTVVGVRTNPDTIELNQSLQPTQKAEVVAEVKDFTSPVEDVKLRFIHVPLEVSMRHMSGTTWVADLSQEQLKTLAVGGETMKYDANVIARNKDGQVSVSKEPVTVAVKTPDLTTRTG